MLERLGGGDLGRTDVTEERSTPSFFILLSYMKWQQASKTARMPSRLRHLWVRRT